MNIFIAKELVRLNNGTVGIEKTAATNNSSSNLNVDPSEYPFPPHSSTSDDDDIESFYFDICFDMNIPHSYLADRKVKEGRKRAGMVGFLDENESEEKKKRKTGDNYEFLIDQLDDDWFKEKTIMLIKEKNILVFLIEKSPKVAKVNIFLPYVSSSTPNLQHLNR